MVQRWWVPALAACLVGFRPVAWADDVVYPRAAVAADHIVASEAGLEMLRLGGNAVDAAVATSFCLSVVRPASCGIGGGGFMLICDPGDAKRAPVALAIDYRETAPAAVGPDFFATPGEAAASRSGYAASGVPGTVAGLLVAHRLFGTLDRRVVLRPAIRAAEEGFAADAEHVRAARRLAERLDQAPHLRTAAAFLWQQLCLDGDVAVGDRIRNPDQARALRLIAERGFDGFYRGPVAEAITGAMAAHGGTITAADLVGYRPALTEPLRGTFRGLEVLGMPPPASGGVALLQILGILERRIDGAPPAHNGPAYVHLVTESMKHAFADRATWLADPSFTWVPVRRLLAPAYLDERAASVDLQRTFAPQAYGSAAAPGEDGGTSHLSVIDGAGMAVACTETINLVYGSLVVVPGFGFALNDEMDDFTTRPGEPNAFGLRQSDRNRPEPGKRPLSSMSPTILTAAGRPVLVAGASGGPRIITATTQCILNCLLFDMAPDEAVAAARFHHQWMPDVLQLGPRWADEKTVAALEALGHRTGRRDDVGAVQIIRVGDDGVRAASDPRRGGAPAGF
jgi:gamma-glutamyltranspeptidase/glutathione hydrolase